MPFTLTMPKLSPTMEGGTIVKWHKQIGDEVKADDLLIEVATDKATVEYNAIDDGFLRKILVEEGADAIINQPIAIFTETADESIEGYEVAPPPKEEAPAEAAPAAEGEASAAPKAPAPTGGAMAQPPMEPEPPLEGYRFTKHPGRVKASPLARKVARDEGIDLSTIKGTGPNGRILRRDLSQGQKGAIVSFGESALPTTTPGSYTEEPLSPMRKAIATRLQASKTFIPHFYVQTEIDASALVETRTQLKNGGIKVTFNDFIVRAVALCLKQYPTINAGFNNVKNTIVKFKTVDIAIAVSFEGGLITPIVRHADYKNIVELSSEVKELAKLAKDGKLAPEQYRGGSFTISNLGMFGIHDFQAVINPPQVAILAVGGILDKAIVRNGAVVPGKVLPLSLSSDHRVVDGADAARFIKSLKELLENPSLLLA